jgi:hypothetical protein
MVYNDIAVREPFKMYTKPGAADSQVRLRRANSDPFHTLRQHATSG